MSTPQPDTAPPAPSVINWYFGPVAWDARPDAMWHAQCPDPYATGHDGEVWLDHHRGAFCSGCRHYEPGQEEQDIPAERAAELPPQSKPWETQPDAAAAALPSQGAPASDAAPAEEEAAAASSSAAAAPLPSPAEALAAADLTHAPADSHPGILGRIKDALEGAPDSAQ